MTRHSSRNAEKGQIVSMDVIMALIIFSIALGGVLYVESSLSNSVRDIEAFRNMQNRLIELTDQFVLTAGDPMGWHNASEIQGVGLIFRDHEVSNDKLKALNRMDSRALRGNLSTGADKVYVQLLNSGGGNCTVGGTNITAGEPPQNAEDEVSIDRYVMTEDSRNCTLRTTLWRD